MALTLRTAGLILVDALRKLSGPSAFDMRPTSVQIVQRTWSGGRRGAGRPSDVVLFTLPSFVKVRQVTQREIASSGARFEEGDIVIGPITPTGIDLRNVTFGFTEAQLVPNGATGVETIFKLAQQAGATGLVAETYFIEFRRDRAMRFELVVGRLRTTPGP